MQDSSNILPCSYLSDRQNDLKTLFNALLQYKNLDGLTVISTNVNVRKRKNCSRRKTRSFRPFKIPKLQKMKTLSVKKKIQVIKFRCHRRRNEQSMNCVGAKITKIFKLPTHLWHCKRMKMQKKFGCVLPAFSKSRGYKFLDKIIKEDRNVVQDISYFKTYQILFHSFASCLHLLSKFMVFN
jgi:hypothetical protein